MKILMVNKFLYPKGGAETYVFRLGEYLQSQGHKVEYFGMEHERRIVGNRVNAYVNKIDFHNGSSLLEKMTYPAKIIYSVEAREKIRLILDDFQPNVCHLNNFNYQLTPSIILEIRKWEKESGHACKIIYTAHDPQLICPNHMCLNPNTYETCEKCFGGHFINCIKGKCIHGSLVRSFLGTVEATVWNKAKIYKEIDTIICCSHFIKKLLDTNSILSTKTVVMHNFVESVERKEVLKKDYILYFGRYSMEKGIATLVQVAKELPNIQFIFAGSGPLEELFEDIPNIRNVDFQSGIVLEQLIREARFTVMPSECYENCPFSVLESQMYGTPVLGANIGGIPELILNGKTGVLFESGNKLDLKKKIEDLWHEQENLMEYSKNCMHIEFDTIKEYTEKLIKFYL